MAETLQDFYDRKYQKRYEAWKPITLRPHSLSPGRTDAIAKLLAREGGRALEVGCSTGEFALAIVAQFDSLVGLDISPSQIALANQVLETRYPHLKDKVRFATADADGPFPFPDASFDTVVCMCVLEHVVDVFHVMDEMARVCRKGGAVALCVPNICYVKFVWSLLRGRVPLTGIASDDLAQWRDHGWDGGHLHYFSKSKLTNLLRHVGFEPEAWTASGRLARLRGWYTNLTGELNVLARRA